jgi:mxaK protein
MKRRHVHFAFAAVALSCGLIAAFHGARLYRALRLNQAIVQASAEAAAIHIDGAYPEARFARAVALAAAENDEAALNDYKALAYGDRVDLKLAALYNLGNLHLREVQKHDPADTLRTLPLIELAKQSYRDLLRLDPNDWNARYNLERALWLAPEDDAAEEELSPPLQSERAITTMKSERGELP